MIRITYKQHNGKSTKSIIREGKESRMVLKQFKSANLLFNTRELCHEKVVEIRKIENATR